MCKRDEGNYVHIPDSEMILRSNREENVSKVSEGSNKETGGHDGKCQAKEKEIHPSL